MNGKRTLTKVSKFIHDGLKLSLNKIIITDQADEIIRQIGILMPL